MRFIPELEEIVTPRQWEVYKTYHAAGCNATTAAGELGITHQAVQNALNAIRVKAAKRGLDPDNGAQHVGDGYRLKGVSVLEDADGKIKQRWVKTEVDREKRQEIMEAGLRAMAEELPQVYSTPATGTYSTDLAAFYPIGDAHIGMFSWAKETGERWDLSIAERVQCEAMARLVKLAPPSQEAVIIDLGDWFHYDNYEAVTSRSGHRVDADGRYPKMITVGVKVMRQCIQSALEHHERVRVISALGNHDDTGAIWMSTCLAHVYEHEPRVSIDRSPSVFNYYRHGKCLVGVHHGHTCKADKLPGVMAADRPQDWGETEYRYWYTGHIHHRTVTESGGCSVESFNTLAAKDAYAHGGGYRAARNMKCIVLHAERGEVERYTTSAQV